jgi:hypothetical protein
MNDKLRERLKRISTKEKIRKELKEGGNLAEVLDEFKGSFAVKYVLDILSESGQTLTAKDIAKLLEASDEG